MEKKFNGTYKDANTLLHNHPMATLLGFSKQFQDRVV